MRRTNIVLDEHLVAAGKRATGIKTSRDLVDHALRELVRRSRQKDLLKLFGAVTWEGNLVRMRSMRGTA